MPDKNSPEISLTDSLSTIIKSHQELSYLLPYLPAITAKLSASTVIISFAHPYFENFYNHYLRKSFETACALCSNQSLSFSYKLQPIENLSSSEDIAHPSPDPFDSFICSPKNAPALKCAKEICQSTSHDYGSVMFYGPSGSGKTHLLNSIESQISRYYGKNSVLRLRADAFESPIPPERFWALTQALLLDDIQTLLAIPEKQILLCNYLDTAFQNQNHGIVILAGTHNNLEKFTPRLAQRFFQALAFEIFPPDFSTRLAFTERWLKNLNINIPKAHLVALARHYRTIPALIGVLQKFKFYASFFSQSLALDELEKLANPIPKSTSWQKILAQVALKLGTKPGEILGKSRRQDTVLARQVAMFICRLKFGLSYPEIGKIFGNRDHATVMHGIKKIQRLQKVDSSLHNLLTELLQEGDLK